MRRYKFALLCLVPAGVLLSAEKIKTPEAAPANPPAFEWPVEKDKKYQISSTFGESRIDHFHNGIDLPGEGSKVLAPKDGRVLYRMNSEFTPGEMPYGGGQYADSRPRSGMVGPTCT